MECIFLLLFFHLLIVSFAVQKLLSLSRGHLFIFVFISIILGDELKKILVQFMSECSAYVFLLSFIDSGLTFRSLIHFEPIFCLWC